MPNRLTGKSAIITGGAKGIGRGIAEVFAREGASVLIVGRDEAAAARVSAAIRDSGGTCVHMRADMQNWADIQAMAQKAEADFGKIDILCANAGIFPPARIDDMAPEDWDSVQSTNLRGAFLSVKACLPSMRTQRYGRIILNSSITGPIVGNPCFSHYAATKAGMIGFMRSAALELARDNITINAVLPGNVRTEGIAGLGEAYIRKMVQAIPLGRLGEPEDVAYAALFLVSDEASFITGQSLVLDGGQVLPETAEAVVG
ncbi:MAG: 3-oxoacyl-ACP reductase FabG [Kiritimatiellae bacterium]|nr:3-oxoacyl-ACP reductase FabG [Kiritimatiellia bacterium]